MKYTEPRFTVPVGSPRITDRAWDRIFLTDREYQAKHPVPTCAQSKAPAGWYCTRALGHDGPCAAIPYIDPEGNHE